MKLHVVVVCMEPYGAMLHLAHGLSGRRCAVLMQLPFVSLALLVSAAGSQTKDAYENF